MTSWTEKRLQGIADGSRAFCGPEQLHIDLTNSCALRCLCCWHRSPLIPPDEVLPHWAPRHRLSYETVLAVLDEAVELGVERIIYSGGGDPFLYPRLFEVLRATAARGIETMLVSTLATASQEEIRGIADSGVARLLVSLWAGDGETYAHMHPGSPSGTFETVMGLIDHLGALRPSGSPPHLIIMNVVCRRNVYNVERMIRLAIEVGAREVWFQPVDVENEHLKPLSLQPEEIEYLIETLRRCSREYVPLLRPGQENLLNFGEFLEKLRNSRAGEGIFHSDIIDSIPCYMGWAECRILANGDVVPCCKADKFPLGNVKRERFRDIWFSPMYDEFRRKAKQLSKSNPYFEKINCAKVCDDWWLNKEYHRRVLASLSRDRRDKIPNPETEIPNPKLVPDSDPGSQIPN